MRMMRLITVFVALTTFPLSALGNEMVEQARKAEQLLQSGQPKAAYEALDGAVEAFWQSTPMFIRKAVYANDITGYGIYKPHAPVFKTDEPHVIYVEPIGFAYGKEENGQTVASWSVDFALASSKGLTLLQRDDFLSLSLPLGLHNREIHLTLTVNLTGLKPGKYVSHYRLKDRNSEKTATFSLPFKVVE